VNIWFYSYVLVLLLSTICGIVINTTVVFALVCCTKCNIILPWYHELWYSTMIQYTSVNFIIVTFTAVKCTMVEYGATNCNAINYQGWFYHCIFGRYIVPCNIMLMLPWYFGAVLLYHGTVYHGNITMVQCTMAVVNSTMVFYVTWYSLPWYFGAVYCTMVQHHDTLYHVSWYNIPPQNTMVEFRVVLPWYFSRRYGGTQSVDFKSENRQNWGFSPHKFFRGHVWTPL